MNAGHTDRSDYKELDDIVRKLELQVGRIEAVLPQVTAQLTTVQTVMAQVAGLTTWREEHEKADAARTRRMAGWSGLIGAFAMKLLDWAHTHLGTSLFAGK